MKKKYETKVEEDTYGYYKVYNLQYDLDDGWEVVKDVIITLKGGLFSSDRIAHIYHMRRDITPTKIAVFVPKWMITKKRVCGYEIDDQQFIDGGLLVEKGDVVEE